MPTLFGRYLSKRELLTYLTDPAQVARVERATLREGRAEGVDVVRFVTGSGFEFTALAGRALDISSASYHGIPLAWRGYPGEVHAAYFEPEGMGWLRGNSGGLLTTGGLSYMGSPSVDDGEALGIHGRISYIPASNVSADGEWDGDEYRLWVRGKVAESATLGPNLVLTREISTAMGTSSFVVRDRVENQTFERIPHMMLYHFNIGYPVLSTTARLLVDSEEVVAREDISMAALDTWDRFASPLAGRAHHLFYHRLRPDAEGRAHVLLVGMQDSEPLGVYLSYSHQSLPWFVNWKCLQPGNYVTGLEPANAWVEGRAVERQAGRLRFLEPWEAVSYEVEFGVLAGSAAIGAFAARHGLPEPGL